MIENSREDPPPAAPPKAPEPPDRTRLRTRGHVEAFGEGRVCAAAECDSVLSRYNSGRLCWTHDQESRKGAKGH